MPTRSYAYVAALITLVALMLVPWEARADCANDMDCKGERICVDGQCVNQEAKPEPAQQTCSKDKDCPGDEVCAEGVCSMPGATPPEPAPPQPEPAPTQPDPAPTQPEPAPGATPGAEAPPEVIPGTGTLRITADQAGGVEVDGRVVGRFDQEPLIVTAIAPGRHEVKVRFDDGGSAAQKVQVVSGQVVAAHMEISTSRKVFEHRKGFHMGIQGGAGYLRFDNLDTDRDPILNGGGVHLGFVTNFGVAPAVDLRTGVEVGLGGTTQDRASLFDGMFGVPIRLQLNIGPVYCMRFGANLGARVMTNTDSGDSQAAFFVAPLGSFTTFRFGPLRQFEIAAEGGSGFTFLEGSVLASIMGRVNFTYLFLTQTPE